MLKISGGRNLNIIKQGEPNFFGEAKRWGDEGTWFFTEILEGNYENIYYFWDIIRKTTVSLVIF